MSTEIKKKTKITITFDFGTFKWFQIINLIGEHSVYDKDVTTEISQEAAKKILNELEYTSELVYPGVEFRIG